MSVRDLLVVRERDVLEERKTHLVRKRDWRVTTSARSSAGHGVREVGLLLGELDLKGRR